MAAVEEEEARALHHRWGLKWTLRVGLCGVSGGLSCGVSGGLWGDCAWFMVTAVSGGTIFSFTLTSEPGDGKEHFPPLAQVMVLVS